MLDITHLLFNDGIQLNGLPAPRADTSQAPICPFTSQDSRFTAAHPTSSTPYRVHHRGNAERDVPFLRRCQGSRPAPYASATTSAWWAEFPHAQGARQPSASSPTQTIYGRKLRDKNYDSDNLRPNGLENKQTTDCWIKPHRIGRSHLVA